MKSLYTKLNKYLLENYPTIWSTKLIEMCLFILFVWIISFTFGYSISLQSINKYNIDRYYTESKFYIGHIIIVLICLIYWGLIIYRHNPLKALYPVHFTYPFQIFSIFFLVIFGLVSAVIPFNIGVYHKTQTLLPFKETINNISDIYKGNIFLVDNIDDYELRNRTQPEVFQNLNRIDYHINDDGTAGWNDNVQYYSPFHKDKSFDSSVLKMEYYRGHLTDKTVLIDKQKFQFYTSIFKQSKDSCQNYSLIDSFYILKNITNLHIYSLYNFKFNEMIYSENVRVNFDRSNHTLKVHQWMNEKQYDSMKRSIISVKKAFTKLGVLHDINPDICIDYLTIKKFNQINAILTHSSKETTFEYAKAVEASQGIMNTKAQASTQAVSASANGNDTFIDTRSSYEVYVEDTAHMYYEREDFNRVKDNFQKANEVYNEDTTFYVMWIALALSMLFSLMFFVDIIHFVIAIPVVGILSLFVGLVCSFFYNTWSSIYLYFPLATLLLLISTIFYFLYIGKVKRRTMDISMCLIFVAIPLLIINSYLLLKNLTDYTTQVKQCGIVELQSIEHSNIIFNEYIAFLLVLIGFCLALFFVKRWKAKEEK
jgi:hypothetical protein